MIADFANISEKLYISIFGWRKKQIHFWQNCALKTPMHYSFIFGYLMMPSTA